MFVYVQSISHILNLMLNILAEHLPFILHVLSPSILGIFVEWMLKMFKSDI